MEKISFERLVDVSVDNKSLFWDISQNSIDNRIPATMS